MSMKIVSQCSNGSLSCQAYCNERPDLQFKFENSGAISHDTLRGGQCNALFWRVVLSCEWANRTQSSCTSGMNESTQCEGTLNGSKRASISVFPERRLVLFVL